MSPKEVMALRIKTFWLMSGNIERILAQKDMRALTVGACAMGGGEAAQEYRQKLVLEIGTIAKMDEASVALSEKRDEEGFAELKELADKR